MRVDRHLGDLAVRGRVGAVHLECRAADLDAELRGQLGEISTAAISWCTSTMLNPKMSSISGKIGPV